MVGGWVDLVGCGWVGGWVDAYVGARVRDVMNVLVCAGPDKEPAPRAIRMPTLFC